MKLGSVYKYSPNRKYNIIRPKTWGNTLVDVMYLTADYPDLRLGDTVEYVSELKNKKIYATFVKKVEQTG